MIDTCRSCKFWKISPADMTAGECCVSPPQAILIPGPEGPMNLCLLVSTKGDRLACEKFKAKSELA